MIGRFGLGHQRVHECDSFGKPGKRELLANRVAFEFPAGQTLEVLLDLGR